MELIKRSLLVIALSCLAISGTAVAKSAHFDSCDGTELDDYKTAKKACKSGEFPGRVIVTCKNNGKEKDRRTCNNSDEKKSIHVGNCAGDEVSEDKFDDACESGSYDGQRLVLCKRGREAKHHQCPIRQVLDPGTVLHAADTDLALAAVGVRNKYPKNKDAQKSTDPKFIDSHTKSFGIGHQELVGFGITMVAHDGSGPAPSANSIIEWDGDITNPNLLIYQKSRGNRKDWPIIGMGFSTLYDSEDVPDPIVVDGVEYPFLVHEAGYHPITNGGFNCADNGDLKTSAYEDGKRIDPEGRHAITRDDLKRKVGQVRHGRIWSHHVWFEPGTDQIAIAMTDPWRRQNESARAIGECAFFHYVPE